MPLRTPLRPNEARPLPMLPIITRDAPRIDAILRRGATFSDAIDRTVADILQQVRDNGDAALLDLSARFDDVRPNPLKVPADVLAAAADALDDDLRRIIAEAADNIRRYHRKQVQDSWFAEDGDGVLLGQRVVPMERAGLYVPG